MLLKNNTVSLLRNLETQSNKQTTKSEPWFNIRNSVCFLQNLQIVDHPNSKNFFRKAFHLTITLPLEKIAKPHNLDKSLILDQESHQEPAAVDKKLPQSVLSEKQ